MLKTLHLIYEGLILLVGITIAASLTTMYMTTVGLVIALSAVYKHESGVGLYGLRVWLAFDRLWNAILRGSDEETVSSRLGKSTLHGHPPVFGFLPIDKVVAHMLDTVDPKHCEKSINWDVGLGEGYV